MTEQAEAPPSHDLRRSLARSVSEVRPQPFAALTAGAACDGPTEEGDERPRQRQSQKNESKPLIVLIDPKWNFDPVACDPDKFFREAEINEKAIASLKGRFEKYSSLDPEAGEQYFTFEDWHNFNSNYALCRLEDEPHYFRAMDQSGEGRLQWSDFLLGCSAANPATPHILNSITGYLRAQYIFRFYNASCSGTLEFEELHHLLAHTRRNVEDTPEAMQKYAQEVAKDLGQVSAITLRINNPAGLVCDMRASTRWTGLRVKREIARQLQVPVEGQELLVGQQRLTEDTVLETIINGEAGSINLTLVRSQWERWPCEPEPYVSDGIAGLERLVHVSFENFYQALTEEQLRGTSRLFRFSRNIMTLRSRCNGGGGGGGGRDTGRRGNGAVGAGGRPDVAAVGGA